LIGWRVLRQGQKVQTKDGEIKELYAKIGQLAVENDFLSQGLKR
jgi:transposase